MGATKYNGWVHKKIVGAVRAGNYQSVAAKICGVSTVTLARWLAEGRKDPTSKYARLVRDIEEAEAQVESAGVASIASRGEKDWKANAFFLERRFPGRWSPKLRVELENEVDHLLAVARKALEPGEFDKLLYALAADEGSGVASEEAAIRATEFTVERIGGVEAESDCLRAGLLASGDVVVEANGTAGRLP